MRDMSPAVSFDWPALDSKFYFVRHPEGTVGTDIFVATWIAVLLPAELTCSRPPEGTMVDLRWTNNEAYEAIRILRNGAAHDDRCHVVLEEEPLMVRDDLGLRVVGKPLHGPSGLSPPESGYLREEPRAALL